jgi:hypothetical protein
MTRATFAEALGSSRQSFQFELWRAEAVAQRSVRTALSDVAQELPRQRREMKRGKKTRSLWSLVP